MNIDKFWNEFLISTNRSPDTKYDSCDHFCMDEKLANDLLKLVLSGKKKATASALLGYAEGEELPKVGTLSIITDWDGVPHCVVETKAVTILPFNEVTFDIAKREGEDDTLESWQAGHRKYFTEEGKSLGYDFSETMQVVFEDFEMIYKI